MYTQRSTTRVKRFLTCLAIAAVISASATNAETQLFWGDTHLHTANSFDVYLFDTPTASANTALRFAQGMPVVSPTTNTRWQLSRPLDFVVLADHAELLGAFPRLFGGDETLNNTKSGRILRQLGADESSAELQAIYDEIVRLGSGLPGVTALAARDLVRDLHAGDRRQRAWEENIEVVEAYNQPGEFTAFIGWEWSSNAGGGNLHRVVFTPNGADVARQFLPFSTLESADPQDLWQWLDETSSATGGDFLAIAHNSNLSMGKMFPLADISGNALDSQYAQQRMRWERVVEITQIKGDSETHPQLSPEDTFADFETFPYVLIPNGGAPDPTEGDYIRSGLKRGIALADTVGQNPFQFGVIGSTDSHTGLSAVEETAFAGKGQHDAIPSLRPLKTGIGDSRGWDMSASGYAAVWATDNTRESLFEAFDRREVYASSGPRITVRLFAGYDFQPKDADGDIATLGYAKGVPMGGELAPRRNRVPQFLFAAMRDPQGANLDRLQIVKGWLRADGSTAEKVYDVALSDGRPNGAIPVGNTVDVTTGRYTNTIGASALSVVWQDPDFDPNQRAFYYGRVLEIPTPRYSLLDALALGIDVTATDRPATIQERAYTSPIWYHPNR